MKILAAVLLLASLMGCATEKKYKDSLEPWINSTEDNLIETWGVPDQTYPLNNGDRLISYNKINKMVFRWGSAIPVGCKTTFKISSTHIVESFRFEGNACKSKYPKTP